MKNLLLILCLISFSVNCFAWTITAGLYDGVLLYRVTCKDGSLGGFSNTHQGAQDLAPSVCDEESHYDGDFDLDQVHFGKR